MKKLLLSLLAFSLTVGLYMTIGPGKQQGKQLKELVQIQTGTWQPRKASRSQGCQLKNKQSLPDPQCTPGSAAPSARSLLCLDAELKRQPSKKPSKKLTRRIKKAYRVKGGQWQINLLIPARLGGKANQANLWPIKKRLRNKKQRVEIKLWREMCAGSVSLNQAQKQIADNWKTANQNKPKKQQ